MSKTQIIALYEAAASHRHIYPISLLGCILNFGFQNIMIATIREQTIEALATMLINT